MVTLLVIRRNYPRGYSKHLVHHVAASIDLVFLKSVVYQPNLAFYHWSSEYIYVLSRIHCSFLHFFHFQLCNVCVINLLHVIHSQSHLLPRGKQMIAIEHSVLVRPDGCKQQFCQENQGKMHLVWMENRVTFGIVFSPPHGLSLFSIIVCLPYKIFCYGFWYILPENKSYWLPQTWKR